MNRIRGLMKQRGFTQEGLASATGMTQPAVSRLINNITNPRLRTAQRVAGALQASVEYVWPYEGHPQGGRDA